ncbi:MAG: hypothetical protein AAF368_21005, partial [Planctomycetota bacterium]
VAAPTRQIDIGRTLLDHVGLAEAPFPGNNLIEIAQGNRPGINPRFSLSAHGFDASITKDGFHYVLQLRDQFQDNIVHEPAHGDRHLFDLKSDPKCKTDLAEDAAQAERMEELHQELITWLAGSRPTGWAKSIQMSAAQVRALAALGYAAGEEAPENPEWWKEPEAK